MSQGSPHDSLFAIALDRLDHVVGELTELLDHLLFGIGVFIRTDMNPWSPEHRLLPFQILFQKAIDKRDGLRIEEIQMIHAIFWTA